MAHSNHGFSCLVVAAGSGTRFGGEMAKQYAPLLGKSVLRHSLDLLLAFFPKDKIRVAIDPGHAAHYAAATEGLGLLPPLLGGRTRQETVRNALTAFAGEDGHILIHDAARPCLSASMLSRLCDAAASGHAAIVPVLPVTDTARRLLSDGSTKTEDRTGLFLMQTPQAFHLPALHRLHEKHADKNATDDACLFELDSMSLHFIAGERDNIKITLPEDLATAESILSGRHGDIRTGQGYDVHRLVPAPADGSRKLFICGVEIPHGFVLEGHSDADVGLHALTDALLGAAGDGDIGQHFSPQDPRWKNADSAKFLRHAADIVMAQGGIISHVDITLVCEAPKISPHRDTMRARVAEILQLPPSRVSIKATTTEGLGFTGRREGIAAQAVATIRLPFTADLPHNEKKGTIV